VGLDLEQLRAFPKVSLHDHLDGALRPSTVAELAGEIGHQLPATDPEELGRWFAGAADSGSLVRYLEMFDHTIAVMQSPAQLRRVAREYVEDLAADGVIYGEARWAPEQHIRAGLTTAQAIEAVRDGLAEGMQACARRGTDIIVRQLITAMRHLVPTRDMADLALRYHDDGVAGFDIAGAEKGFPPARFIESFWHLRRNNAYYTIHAGEADGLSSIEEAVQLCAANRIGHGVAIMDDIRPVECGPMQLGDFAAYVRNERICLEMCPSSNVHTGAAASIPEHPIAVLADLDFRVTVNTDNRLMSATTLTDEFALLGDAFNYSIDQVRWFSRNAAKSAFAPYEMRRSLIDRINQFD
jgi:adenosine deaminase